MAQKRPTADAHRAFSEGSEVHFSCTSSPQKIDVSFCVQLPIEFAERIFFVYARAVPACRLDMLFNTYNPDSLTRARHEQTDLIDRQLHAVWQ